MSLRETLRRQPPWAIVSESLALIGVIGWVDFITGWEWSFFVFYALPIGLVVWRTNLRVGLAFAVLCTGVWWAAQIDSHPYTTTWGFALAAVSRLFYFGAFVVAAAAMKGQREFDSARIQTLEHAQRLEREILRTAEREQQRIGRDLHDSLGPHLVAIGYAATFLANGLRKRDQPESAEAEKIRDLVRDAVSLTRDLARGLFPVQMDSTGLAVALEDLAATTSRLMGVTVTFCETGDPLVADPETSMHLYRIVQEAVTNAVRHGKAQKVTIVLSGSEEALRLVIADDGKGMAPTAHGGPGMGLHTMRYRVRALGGDIEFRSNPSEGTIVSCEIPLLPAASEPISS